MNTQSRRTLLIAFLLLPVVLPNLWGQTGSGFTDDDDDTTISYVFPILQMSKSEFVDLGPQGIRSTLTLNNAGDGPLTIQSLKWQGSSEYVFASPPSLPLTIEPGAQQQLEVLYIGSRPVDDLPYELLNVTSNNRPSISFALLMDVSRSMLIDTVPCQGTYLSRLDMAKQRSVEFLENAMLFFPDLALQDELSLQSYSNNLTLNVSPLPITTATLHSIKEAINSLQAINGTHLGQAVSGTISRMKSSSYRHRVMILICDGETHDMDKIAYPVEEVVRQAKQAGIVIFALGIALDEPEARSYLNDLTIPTGGFAFFADNCTSFAIKLNRISTASHSVTVDTEPFPTGQTLSAPAEEKKIGSAVAITGITPNPGGDYVEIAFRSADPGSTELLFYNAQGERMEAGIPAENGGSGEQRLRADVHTFPAGVYVAVLTTADGSRTSGSFTIIR